MTTEEKANEICKRHIFDSNHYDCCMEMAKWKVEQAIEYLYENIKSLLKDYGVSEASAEIATKLFLANFKQAMEE